MHPLSDVFPDLSPSNPVIRPIAEYFYRDDHESWDENLREFLESVSLVYNRKAQVKDRVKALLFLDTEAVGQCSELRNGLFRILNDPSEPSQLRREAHATHMISKMGENPTMDEWSTYKKILQDETESPSVRATVAGVLIQKEPTRRQAANYLMGFIDNREQNTEERKDALRLLLDIYSPGTIREMITGEAIVYSDPQAMQILSKQPVTENDIRETINIVFEIDRLLVSMIKVIDETGRSVRELIAGTLKN